MKKENIKNIRKSSNSIAVVRLIVCLAMYIFIVPRFGHCFKIPRTKVQPFLWYFSFAISVGNMLFQFSDIPIECISESICHMVVGE